MTALACVYCLLSVLTLLVAGAFAFEERPVQ